MVISFPASSQLYTIINRKYLCKNTCIFRNKCPIKKVMLEEPSLKSRFHIQLWCLYDFIWICNTQQCKNYRAITFSFRFNIPWIILSFQWPCNKYQQNKISVHSLLMILPRLAANPAGQKPSIYSKITHSTLLTGMSRICNLGIQVV